MVEIVRSYMPEMEGERNGIHSLFIIRETGWYRFARCQSAKECVESAKAMLRYADLVIGRVGRWVEGKKRHWRLTTLELPNLLLSFFVPRLSHRCHFPCKVTSAARAVALEVEQRVGSYRLSVYLPSMPPGPSKYLNMTSKGLGNKGTEKTKGCLVSTMIHDIRQKRKG